MNVVRAFISVYRLEVQQMTDHLVLLGDPIATVHVSGKARDLERLARVVALQDRDHLGRSGSLVEQSAHPQRGL